MHAHSPRPRPTRRAFDVLGRADSVVVLHACQEAAAAAPSSMPLQLMYARELLRTGAPMEALTTLQTAHESVERQKHRLRQRAQSQQRIRTRSSGAVTANARASSTVELTSGLGNGFGASGGSAGSADAPATPQDPSLLRLVSRCLAHLDARQLAELATLRHSPARTTSTATSPSMARHRCLSPSEYARTRTPWLTTRLPTRRHCPRALRGVWSQGADSYRVQQGDNVPVTHLACCSRCCKARRHPLPTAALHSPVARVASVTACLPRA